MAERIVVVGLGAITCLGRTLDETWTALIAGRSGLRRHDSLDPEQYLQSIAGLVPESSESGPVDDSAVSKLRSRCIQLGIQAARQAWSDSRLSTETVDPHRVGVIVGTGIGGIDEYHAESLKAAGRRSLATSPYLVPSLIPNMAAGQIAQDLGVYGPSVAPASACATGGHALALAGMTLRAGEADVVLAGGTESAFTPLVVNGFATMKAMLGKKAGDRAEEDPSQASRPFSIDRAGFVMAEGAAVLVVTTESFARRMGLEIQAELAGWAMNSDGYHMAMPNPERVAKCLELALRHSEMKPDEIDYYNAHGTSTVVNDRAETQSVKNVFGDHAVKMPVSSIKGAVGHALGAAPAIEAAVCVRALRDRIIPPTINYRPDPELDLDYVPGEGRAHELNTLMSASFGFGGMNSALVLRRFRDG